MGICVKANVIQAAMKVQKVLDVKRLLAVSVVAFVS
jgi:hypothetical protein